MTDLYFSYFKSYGKQRFSGKIWVFPFHVAIKGQNQIKLHFFSHILYREDKYKLHFHIQPLLSSFPLVILLHFLCVLPLILLKKTTNQSLLKKAIDKSFSFQWILVRFKVLLTRLPSIYLEQFICPTNSSKQLWFKQLCLLMN